MKISEVKMPQFTDDSADWAKWRACWKGGDDFIEDYLEQFSTRETAEDFATRKNMTPASTFAKTAIKEVRDSIFERMCDITRVGGSNSYMMAVLGKEGGVDFEDSSMDYFMGTKLLEELLVMRKVGVYVDMDPKKGISLADNQNLRPYIYIYPVEDICGIEYQRTGGRKTIQTLLLRENFPKKEFGIVVEYVTRYRYIQRTAEGVLVKFYNAKNVQIDIDGQEIATDYVIPIPEIPFHVCEISESLMADVANYQIAIMNLSSSDINYSLRSNFPLYVEQFEPLAEQAKMKPSGKDSGGESADGNTSKTKEIAVGVSRGRRYPKGMDQPAFINPSPEPLKASMEKQEQLKAEIRQLVRLTVANLRGPVMASAESKDKDNKTLETGLSYIGMALQHCENQIAKFWQQYEKAGTIAEIRYPTNYSLRSEQDRREEVDHLDKLMSKVPSKTYQKLVAKRISQVLLGHYSTSETMEKIHKEIDNSEVIMVDSETLINDFEAGFIGVDLASQLRGYPKGEAEKARKDHADRLARIATAQAAGTARGVDADSTQTKADHKFNKNDPAKPAPQRGEGNGNSSNGE